MTYVREDSVMLVNLSSKENTKLNTAAIINIVTTPYIMAELTFFVSIMFNLLIFESISINNLFHLALFRMFFCTTSQFHDYFFHFNCTLIEACD